MRRDGHSSLTVMAESPHPRRRMCRLAVRLASVAALAVPIGAVGGVAHAGNELEAGPTRVSLWDRPVPGTDLTYAELTIEGKSPGELEPVLLPLPAPALAAGVGLGLAWIIRRRLDRR